MCSFSFLLLDHRYPMRFKFAFRLSFYHLLISFVVACLTAGLVFIVWYPSPFEALLSVSSIYLLLLFVDVVCGPMLTMVLADPLKSRRELSLDLGLVAVIQLLALFYGIYSVALGRPVAVVFEKDRYVVVSASEVSEKHLAEANSPFNSIPLIGIQHLSVRNPSGSDEFLESLDLSLQGVSPSMRPNWWQDYDVAVDEIAKKALPLQNLHNSRSSADKILLDKAIADSGSSANNLYYLPVVSATVTDWIALLDSNYKIVTYAHVNGF